jgi:hypothetical protein
MLRVSVAQAFFRSEGFWFELPWPITERRSLIPKGMSDRSWRWFAAELSCALWRGGSVLAGDWRLRMADMAIIAMSGSTGKILEPTEQVFDVCQRRGRG